MKKNQNVIKICLLFMLLSVLAILPIEVTHIQNRKLIDQVYVNRITEDKTPYKALKATEKLDIIANSNNTIVEDNKNLKKSDSEDISAVIKQLEVLKEYNVFPLIDFNERLRIERELKTTYVDTDNYKNIINIKEFIMVVQNYSIRVSMDMDTSVIYELTVIAREGELPKYKTIFSPTSYIYYLGLPSKNILVEGENSKGWLIYKDQTSNFLYEYNRNERFLSFDLGGIDNKKNSKIKAITSTVETNLN